MLKRFVRDMLAYMPSLFLPALTALITTPILTRLFPPAEYGYYALALSASAFLVVLAATGFGSAVIRFYPACEANPTLNVFFAIIGVFVCSAILIAAAANSTFMQWYWVPVIGIIMGINEVILQKVGYKNLEENYND